jgi:hypothetical protein
VLPPGIERSSRSKISRDLSVLIPYPASVRPKLPSPAATLSTYDHRPPVILARIIFYGILVPSSGRLSYAVHPCLARLA